jgi:hypothetical protein
MIPVSPSSSVAAIAVTDFDHVLAVMQPMETADVLLQSSLPGDRHGEEKRVECASSKPSPI